MALSRETYQGDGQTNAFAVPFPYLSRDNVKVTVEGAPVPFTWLSDGLVQILPAPQGAVTVYRETQNTAGVIYFNDGSVLDESMLEAMSKQLLYICQEVLDVSAVSDATSVDALSKAAEALATSNVAEQQSGVAVETSTIAELKASEAVATANEAKSLIDAAVLGGVVRFNGRSGQVLPQAGDYTKDMVGLGNVDNTSDVDKPISTAQAVAFAAQADNINTRLTKVSPSYTGGLTGDAGVIQIGVSQFYKGLDGKFGFGTTTPSVSLDIAATDAIRIPAGSNLQRPGAAQGLLRFNTDLQRFEGSTGSSWGSLGGASGGGGDSVFYLNGKTVTTDFTIPAGQNAMSAGPITINDGVTVTIADGSVWSIV